MESRQGEKVKCVSKVKCEKVKGVSTFFMILILLGFAKPQPCIHHFKRGFGQIGRAAAS